MDEVERMYKLAIAQAVSEGDSDYAYELSVGLKQYRESYQCTNG